MAIETRSSKPGFSIPAFNDYHLWGRNSVAAPFFTSLISIMSDDQDLIDFARAVEQAVEAGYKEGMSEDVKPDLESSLVS